MSGGLRRIDDAVVSCEIRRVCMMVVEWGGGV